MSTRRKFLFLVVLVIGSLFLAEGGYRLVLLLSGKGYDASGTAAEIEDVARSLSGPAWMPAEVEGRARGRVLHPFHGYEVRGIFDEASAEALQDAEEGVLRVMVVGGSVARALVATSSASVLRAAEEASSPGGRRLRLINLAHAGFKQPQQVMVVAHLLGRGARPDLVLNIDGVNEVALGLTNHHRGADPSYPALNQWAPLARRRGVIDEEPTLVVAARALEESAQGMASLSARLRLSWSAVLGRAVLSRMTRIRSEWVALSDRYEELLADTRDSELTGREVPGRKQDGVLEAIVREWIESSVSLQALCASRGILYLHVLQPTLHDEGSKPLTPDEKLHGEARESWIEGVREGYPRLRAAGPGLVERGVDFRDLSLIFRDVTEPVYVDSCHLDVHGNEIFGREVGRAVAEVLHGLRD